MSKLINFRDLGGHTTTCGKKLRMGRLLRSGVPTELTTEDIARLKNHGLAQIIDLRRPWETEITPTDAVDSVVYLNIDVMADNHSRRALGPNEWLDGLVPHRMDDEMLAFYHGYITLSSAIKGYRDFVRACLANETGAILFHCAHGKDRTGFAAALLLRILGVVDEDIYADYLKTNEERKEANAAAMEGYRAKGLNDEQLAAMVILYNVKPEYLAAAFAAINAEYGSFETYIEQALGITKEDITKLKKLYLE
ncbi:MAG: tyrosine-protein phosphatase [Defluviitaleaceae bacterium]|nr:tyrosine-protein phosphatase [Defluviitaleaceae bacterium]